MKDIFKSIARKTGVSGLVAGFHHKLNGSDWNSFLLEIFRERTAKVTPSELLKKFSENRFCRPSGVDPIAMKELEIRCLSLARERGFSPVILSPLAPLATCSALAPVDQNNIVSALRGTEVVSDATNVLALLVAEEFKKDPQKDRLRYACTHRLVRAQTLLHPAFTAHFGIFCLVTGGRDRGDFRFETEQFLEHMEIHLGLLSQLFPPKDLVVHISLAQENSRIREKLEQVCSTMDPAIRFEFSGEWDGGAYYQTLRGKISLDLPGELLNLTDGGMVDWTQQLLSDRKQRLFISGSGLELIRKMADRAS
jgi:hypothetical protein